MLLVTLTRLHELSCHERPALSRFRRVGAKTHRGVSAPTQKSPISKPGLAGPCKPGLAGPCKPGLAGPCKPVHHEQETSGRSTKHVNTINELRNSYCPHGLKGIPCIPASGGSTSSNDFNHVSQSATIRVTYCVISNTPSRIVVREPAVAKSFTQ